MKCFLSVLTSFLCFSGVAQSQYVCGSVDSDTIDQSDIAVALRLDYTNSMVYITMTGPTDDWFAIGFSGNMAGAYAIIVDGDGDVTERKLGPTNTQTGAGDLLNTTVAIENITNDGNSDAVRTVVLSRALDIGDSDYFTFDTYTASSSISIIYGTSASTALAYHGSSKGSATLDFVENVAASDAQCDLTEEATTQTPKSYICGYADTRSEDNMAVYLRIDEDTSMIYITMTGNDAQWFGAGFGSSTMDGTYAIIADNSGVSERELADQSIGTELSASVTTESDVSSEGIRTVLLSRSLDGTDASYFTFDTTGTIFIIWATSESSSFEVHPHNGNGRGSTSITLNGGWAADDTVCGEAIPEEDTTTTTDDITSTSTASPDDPAEDAATNLASKVVFVCVMSGLLALNW